MLHNTNRTSQDTKHKATECRSLHPRTAQGPVAILVHRPYGQLLPYLTRMLWVCDDFTHKTEPIIHDAFCRKRPHVGNGWPGMRDMPLPPTSEGWGRYCFRRCVSVRSWGRVGGGFTPSPSYNTSTGPMSIPGGVPSPSCRLGEGYPNPRWGGGWHPSLRWRCTSVPGGEGGTQSQVGCPQATTG